ILIPRLKRAFSLTTVEASLVDFAVYIGYFLMALPAGALMRRYGYKAGIIVGLLLFTVGSFLFIPAANTKIYAFFLGALFVIACGICILETAANPYASLLGSPEKSTQRLNFAQSFNGLAVSLAPAIGVRVIMTDEVPDAKLALMSAADRAAALATEAESVKMPYFVLGCILLVVTIFFMFTKLPKIQHPDTGKRGVLEVLSFHRHLRAGVLAEFFYVGAQVCVFSFFLLLAKNRIHLSKTAAGDYLAICGLAFMIGRFFGTFLMQYINPARLLTFYATINIVLCGIVIGGGDGMLVIYAIVAMSFFMSIMFPTIFALSIKDLKSDTEYGSSLLIMSIVGGAVLPLLFAYITDHSNIQNAYVVPLLSFVVIGYFGLRGHKLITKSDIINEEVLPGV
ncbi:MAG: L-fucose:H+ symporter permease, partial [Bacteroidetes bacterium]|nr:L-fucose:H+ symporter permease [Bacteroidota bacterium]